MREKYRLADLMAEIEKDEKIREQDMNRKLSQEQIRRMLKTMRDKRGNPESV